MWDFWGFPASHADPQFPVFATITGATVRIIPQGSGLQNNEYLAQTIFMTPYVETQSPHYVGTSTLIGFGYQGHIQV